MYTAYEQLPATSRVWIYQSSRALTADEQARLLPQIRSFVEQWTSHREAVSAWGGILHDYFLVLIVDESQVGTGGCSIDSSVAFVRAVGDALGIDWFDRWNFAYWQGDAVHTAQRDDFAHLYQKGEINDQTLVFNNLIQTKADLENQWKVPMSSSWHRNFV